MRDAGRSAPRLLTSLRPYQWLVRRVDAERPGRGRNLDKPVEGFVQLLAGDCCEDLPNAMVELGLAQPAIGVGLLEPGLGAVTLFRRDLHLQTGVLVDRVHD